MPLNLILMPVLAAIELRKHVIVWLQRFYTYDMSRSFRAAILRRNAAQLGQGLEYYTADLQTWSDEHEDSAEMFIHFIQYETTRIVTQYAPIQIQCDSGVCELNWTPQRRVG